MAPKRFLSNPSMKQLNQSAIYLDSHATTPVDQEVLDSMLPFFTQYYGNGNHKAGWKTNSALEEARLQVSTYIGARPTELIFTSGATEAINLALSGLAQANPQSRKHIITQRTEHKAVLQCIENLKLSGYKVTTLDVDTFGRIDLGQLMQHISDDTLVVAIMLANNEIGTVQPVKEIGRICRTAGAKFFCDLTQGIGWHPIDVDEMNIDLAAMSAHKIYGPRGIGALYVRRKRAKVELSPLLFGGGQERGLRPGTANVPGAVGFGKAINLLAHPTSMVFERIRALRDRLQGHLFSAIDGIQLNGCPLNRHPANLNIAIPHVSGEDLIGALPQVLFSTGSACSSGSAKPSHVISSLPVDPWVLSNTMRFGICKFNTEEEIDYVANEIIQKVRSLQDRREHRSLKKYKPKAY